MNEHQQPYWSDDEPPRGAPATPLGLPFAERVPPKPAFLQRVPPELAFEEVEPTILGFPAEYAEDDEGSAGVSEPAIRTVVLRHADRLGGVALVSAGIAAGVSLWLPWRRGERDTGLSMARRGVTVFRSGIQELGHSGLWQALAVVLGGGALLLLGLLLFRRARAHRFVGLLALMVAVAAAAGVLVPLAAVDWSIHAFDLGMWFAVAVAGLGVLGALKAMLTAPHVQPGPRWPGRSRPAGS